MFLLFSRKIDFWKKMIKIKKLPSLSLCTIATILFFISVIPCHTASMFSLMNFTVHNHFKHSLYKNVMAWITLFLTDMALSFIIIRKLVMTLVRISGSFLQDSSMNPTTHFRTSWETWVWYWTTSSSQSSRSPESLKTILSWISLRKSKSLEASGSVAASFSNSTIFSRSASSVWSLKVV